MKYKLLLSLSRSRISIYFFLTLDRSKHMTKVILHKLSTFHGVRFYFFFSNYMQIVRIHHSLVRQCVPSPFRHQFIRFAAFMGNLGRSWCQIRIISREDVDVVISQLSKAVDFRLRIFTCIAPFTDVDRLFPLITTRHGIVHGVLPISLGNSSIYLSSRYDWFLGCSN